MEVHENYLSRHKVRISPPRAIHPPFFVLHFFVCVITGDHFLGDLVSDRGYQKPEEKHICTLEDVQRPVQVDMEKGSGLFFTAISQELQVLRRRLCEYDPHLEAKLTSQDISVKLAF